MNSAQQQKKNDGKTFRLRWRLEFANKPTIYGRWNHFSQDSNVWAIDKSGLLFAIIEAEDCETFDIIKVIECVGQDFRQFCWTSFTVVGSTQSFDYRSHCGLSMLCRDFFVTAFLNGTTHVKKLEDEDKIKFATDSNGGV